MTDGLTAHEAVRACITRCESMLRTNDRQQAAKVQEITTAENQITVMHSDLESLESTQRALLAELEGLRIAWRRVALQDAELLAQVAGDTPTLDD